MINPIESLAVPDDEAEVGLKLIRVVVAMVRDVGVWFDGVRRRKLVLHG